MEEGLKTTIIKELLKRIESLEGELDEEKNIDRSREGYIPLSDVEAHNAQLVIPEENGDRASGRTTRLIDKYIQDLFYNKGEWVEILDHYDDRLAHKNLLARIVDRLKNEHGRIEIIQDISNIKLKIQ